MRASLFGTLAGGGTPVNPDAQAFITAAGITDPTQQAAVNTLVNDLQTANLWTQLGACYPIVGGTASQHKYNLKDPRDLDAAFRLTFAGGWTHSATGALPNGSSGYADTHYAPSANFALGNAHWSYYSRSDVLETKAVMGAQTGGVGPWVLLRNSVLGASNILADYYAGISDRLGGAEADSLGMHTFTATGGDGGAFKAFKEGVQLGVSAVATGSLTGVTNTFYLAAINNSGSASFFTTRECAGATLGSGLSDADAAALNTCFQTFNTALGRQV